MKKYLQENKWVIPTSVAGFFFVFLLLYSFSSGSVDTASATVSVDNPEVIDQWEDVDFKVTDDSEVMEESEENSMLSHETATVSVEEFEAEVDSEFEETATESFEEVVSTVIPATGPGEDESQKQAELVQDQRIEELRSKCSNDLRRANWKRAHESLVELVNLRPYNADYHLTLGLVHRRLQESQDNQGHLDEAQKKFSEYVEYGGEEAIASLLLAEASASSNDMESTYEFLEEAALQGMNIARAVKQFPALRNYIDDTRFVRSALKLERYTLEDDLRRDPFTAPWKSSNRMDETTEFTYLSVSEQRDSLFKARSAIAKIEFAQRNGDFDAATEAYRALMNISDEAKRFDQPELAAELKAIVDRIEELEQGVEEVRVRHLYEESRVRLDSMKRAFEEQDFATVNQLYSEVQKLASEIQDVGDKYRTTSTLVGMAASQMRQRSEVVQQFLSRTVQIDGVVISGEGSYAIVDGEWIAKGGDVEGAVLEEVHRDRLVFNFEGELIVRRFGRF